MPETFYTYSFQSCGDSTNKFRYENISAELLVGEVYYISGGFDFEGCAQVIELESIGPLYDGTGVTFTQQQDCYGVFCDNNMPTPVTFESFTPLSLSCTCIDYTVSNLTSITDFVYYTDCYDQPQAFPIAANSSISICACQDTVTVGDGMMFVESGECPPIPETPPPTPSVTPTMTPSPSVDWNLCNQSFCLVTYEPELDLYNGTYSVSGTSFYNGRYVFSGDVQGVIYYNSTNNVWCLSDTIGGTCLLSGPTPSYTSCPDLWNVIFSQGVCNTTTTTNPCDTFDFEAYFDCDVPVSPSPTPTSTPTPTPTPTPSPSNNICNFVVGDIDITPYTTTTTTIPVTTTTTTICYSPVTGSETYSILDTVFVCPGTTLQFTNCQTNEVYYIEPSSLFNNVNLVVGYVYSFTIGGGEVCATYNGSSSISSNYVIGGPVTLYLDCSECGSAPVPVSQSPTPTPTVTPTVTSTVTPTASVTPTITPTKTNTPTPTPSSSTPLVEYYGLVDGSYCCVADGSFTDLLVKRINFPIQSGFVYYDGEGRCFTITDITPTSPTGGATLIGTNFADCQACRSNSLTNFLSGYCYDGRMLADSGSAATNCFQVQAGLGSATRYRSNYPYSYLFTGQWQTVDMYIMDVTTNCLLISKPISDGCQYWETDSNGKVIAGYPQIGFDCSGAGGCCPGIAPLPE